MYNRFNHTDGRQYNTKQFLLKNVVVDRMIIPKLYSRSLADPGARVDMISTSKIYLFTRLGEASDSFAYKVFRFVDELHEYDLECTKETNRFSRLFGYTTYIARITASRLICITASTIRRLAITFGGLSDSEAQGEIERAWAAQEDPGAHPCGIALRAFSGRPWYSRVEGAYREAFSEWYASALAPQYSPRWLAVAGTNAVFAVARVASSNPIALSCRWMHSGDAQRGDRDDLATVEEIPISSAMAVAKRFGSHFDAGVATAIESVASRGGSLWEARERGDSFVPKAEFDASVPDPGVRRLLVRSGVVGIETVLGEPGVPSERVFLAADRRCELDVARLLLEIVTSGDGGRDCEMVDPDEAWPACSEDGATLNPDQAAAVAAALSRRLFFVTGRPGVGKTTYVARSIKSAFARGTVLGVAYTGIAARRLRDATGTGVTAHSVIASRSRSDSDDDYAPFKFGGRHVLLVEEASMMPISLLRSLLLAMRGDVRRVYFFGDPDQMPPIGGGASILDAAVRRYSGTPMMCYLTFSERNTDATGVIVRNLRRLCEYNGGVPLRDGDGDGTGGTQSVAEPLEFEWSDDPRSGHPFVFCRIGNDAASTAGAVRRVVAEMGMDPDAGDGRFEVIVMHNEYRKVFSRAWWESSKFGKPGAQSGYGEWTFAVGERVMFLVNTNGGTESPGSGFITTTTITTTRQSKRRQDDVMNGTTGTLVRIFDVAADGSEVDVQRTDADAATSAQRWISVRCKGGCDGDTVTVQLHKYGARNIARVPPATVAKVQGLETEISIVVVEGSQRHWDRKKLNTACSRGKRGCVIFSDMYSAGGATLGGDHGSPRPCPSQTVNNIVSGTRLRPRFTSLWSALPSFGDIDSATAVAADALDGQPSKRKRKLW